MTDYFAVLRCSRRPWIDADQLKREYQQLSLTTHPDRNQAADAKPSEFAGVTEAYRVLSNPRLRLQHLLALETGSDLQAGAAQVTADLSDVFVHAAALVRDIDGFLQRRGQTTSALATALLKSESETLRMRTGSILRQLEELHGQAVQQLRCADERWINGPEKPFEDLRALAQRFAFLDRWIDQLRERQFQLSL